jgi:hypothetical protein
MNNSELIRIVENLPVAERSPFLLAQLAIKQSEADAKKAEAESKRTEAEARRDEFIRNLSPEELARIEGLREYDRVTQEKKAERDRKLADLRKATLEDMKTRSFRDIMVSIWCASDY